jgi:hypothetical protein
MLNNTYSEFELTLEECDLYEIARNKMIDANDFTFEKSVEMSNLIVSDKTGQAVE